MHNPKIPKRRVIPSELHKIFQILQMKRHLQYILPFNYNYVKWAHVKILPTTNALATATLCSCKRASTMCFFPVTIRQHKNHKKINMGGSSVHLGLQSFPNQICLHLCLTISVLSVAQVLISCG